MAQEQTLALAALETGLEQRRRQLQEPMVGLQRSWAQLELERSLETVEAFRVVSSHWPLTWHNLPTRFWSGLNRLLRRYLRWYIDPIVSQQNAFNAAVCRLLLALKVAQDDLRRQQVAPVRFAGPLEAMPGPEQDERFAALSTLVAACAALEPPAAFPDLELLPLLRAVEAQREVQAHWELVGTRPYEHALIMLHKLVRRYLRWLINPIVAQQNRHNSAVCRALAALVALDAESRAALARQRAERPSAS